jgi:hypothetical protein
MNDLLTTTLAALLFMSSAWAEPATIYGTLTLTAPGDGIDSPTGRYCIVKTKYPVTVEMESYEQNEEGKPPVIVQVVTREIQIIVHPDTGEGKVMTMDEVAAMSQADIDRSWAELEKAEGELDRFLKTLLRKKVRVTGETRAPHNWNHRTPVLLSVYLKDGGSIREAAPLAPKGSNERGKR